MRILLADVLTNAKVPIVNNFLNGWNWIELEYDGNVCKVPSGPNTGMTFQQMDSGSFKYDNVPNPGTWEKCRPSNGQMVWGNNFSRVYVEKP